MKKKIYFKECWDSFYKDDNSKEYKCEMLWKTHRWWPFWKKFDGTFDAMERFDLFMKYDAEYDVYVWEEIFSHFVPFRCML